MTAMTDVKNTGPQYLSREEASDRLGTLSAADCYRLERIAKGRTFGLVLDWQDLLQEAFARVISGSRRCPDNVEFMAFLAQTIRSVANEERRRQYSSSTIPMTESTDVPVSIVDRSTDVEGEVYARRMLESIYQHFKSDDSVTKLIHAYELGETASETILRTGLSPLDYDAARKRFARGIGNLFNSKGK